MVLRKLRARVAKSKAQPRREWKLFTRTVGREDKRRSRTSGTRQAALRHERQGALLRHLRGRGKRREE